MKTNRRNFRNGLVLITALWILALISLLAVGLAGRVRYHTAMTRNRLNRLRAFSAADAGLRLAISLIEEDPDPLLDSRKDAFFDNAALFRRQHVLGPWGFSVAAKALDPDAPARFGVECLNGRLNLHRLRPDQVERILEDVPLYREPFAAVLDWIDPDGDPGNHGSGAEKEDYADAGSAAVPADGPIALWEELEWVRGASGDFRTWLRRRFTLHGDGKINPHFAEPATLRWIGLSEAMIDRFERYFRGPDGQPGTEDDQAFSAVEKIAEELDGFETLYADEFNEIAGALSSFTLSTSWFRVRVVPEKDGKAYPPALVALVERGESGCAVRFQHRDPEIEPQT
jgi:type II secretory pathway component PulK